MTTRIKTFSSATGEVFGNVSFMRGAYHCTCGNDNVEYISHIHATKYSTTSVFYRVMETGVKEKGGDGTAARIRDFLVLKGFRVFLDVGVLEGTGINKYTTGFGCKELIMKANAIHVD